MQRFPQQLKIKSSDLTEVLGEKKSEENGSTPLPCRRIKRKSEYLLSGRWV